MLPLPVIPVPDAGAAKAAQKRQLQLTKPTGSLGQLDSLSIQLAAIAWQDFPSVAVQGRHRHRCR